jgi:hypothetical protein
MQVCRRDTLFLTYTRLSKAHDILKETMTMDERFERIERVTAGLAEERRKDREEFVRSGATLSGNSTTSPSESPL